MQAKLLHEFEGERTYAVILETGDEVMGCIQQFATEHGLTAASFKAIGGFSAAELGFFVWDEKQYRPIPVQEQTEVAALTGDIVIGAEGEVAVHVHVVLGKADGSAVAGHLKSALVRPTLEIVLVESPNHLRKRFDPELGIALIDPER